MSDYFGSLTKNRKDLVSVIVVVLTIIGIPIAVMMVQNQQILRSRASTTFIEFKGANVEMVDNGTRQIATSQTIDIKVTAPGNIPTPAPRSPQASILRLSTNTPADGDSVTVTYQVNSDVNFVNLAVDGCERWNADGSCNFQSGTIITQERITSAGEKTITWTGNHIKHTPGPHSVGIHAYYCANDDPRGSCVGPSTLALDQEEVTVGGGSPVLSGTPSADKSTVAVGQTVTFRAQGTNTTRIGIGIFYNRQTQNPPPFDIAGSTGCNTPSATNCVFTWTVPVNTPKGTHNIRFVPINGVTQGDAVEIPLTVSGSSVRVWDNLMSHLPLSLLTVETAEAVFAGCGDGPQCTGNDRGYCSCSVTCWDGSTRSGGFCYPIQTAAANCDAVAKCPPQISPSVTPLPSAAPAAETWASCRAKGLVFNGTVCSACPTGKVPDDATQSCVAPTPTAAPGGAAQPAGGQLPAGAVITHYKISETNLDAVWVNVTPQTYTAGGLNTSSYTFLARTCTTQPCDTYPREDRTIFVQFIGTLDSQPYSNVQQAQITLAIPPVLNSVSCESSPTGTGSIVTVNGLHFGTNVGSVQVKEQSQNAQNLVIASSGGWNNLQVAGTTPNILSTVTDVTLTSVDGKQSNTLPCTPNKSQIDFKATLACRTVDKPLTTAEVEVKEASSGASVFKQDKVNFSADGRPQGLLPQLIEGKDYKLIIKAPSSLTKVITFKAAKGTTSLQALGMPLGDIYPATPDCTINSLDKNEMVRQWSAGKDATGKSANLNSDRAVNSIDYSCLISNFNKTCDVP